MNRIYLRLPSTTANVGPGYDIFSMALAEIYDEMLITLNCSDKINIFIEGEANNNIPLNIEDNSIGVAIVELFKRKNIKQGVDVKLFKKMPSGCGLGTTGAAAAGSIFGLNKLLALDLSDNEMVDIARFGEIASGGSPHADNVASALLGGFVLIKSYSPLEVIKLNVPEFPAVIAIIRKSLKTTRGFITYEIGQEKLKEQMAHCSMVIHAIHTNNIEDFGKAITIDHIAEPVRSAAIPKYWDNKTKTLEAGAYGCTISGGGSSVIAYCKESLQDKIVDIFQTSFADNPNFIKVVKTRTSNTGVVEIL